MPNFSERNGLQTPAGPIERHEVSERLRLDLWNVLNDEIWCHWPDMFLVHPAHDGGKCEQSLRLAKKVWADHMGEDLDDFTELKSASNPNSYDVMKARFIQSAEWNEVFDFIEFVVESVECSQRGGITNRLNTAFSRRNSAYRLVEHAVIEIVDEHQISAINEALAGANTPERVHLEAAIKYLSCAREPDYRNSIKESISAVEAACQRISGSPSATLGDALKRVPNLHPALSNAFKALYGFASDGKGIRHAMGAEAVQPTAAEARFMLISCSAFLAFLHESA